MAETLSYDNTPETDVLSEEEQDSLQVGEKLVEAQEQLLAGKYKSAEDLEQAYLSLQKKLGQTEEEEVDYESTDEGYEEEETIERFSEMSSQDLVNAYLQIQANNPQAPQQTYELSESEVNTVQNAAGGEANYNRVVSWAAENLTDAAIDAFDSVVDSGNTMAIQIAFAGLQAEYNEANGYEGRMLQGKAPNRSGNAYRSQAELVAAMGDPRYDSDPAYRADVVARLEQSDIEF